MTADPYTPPRSRFASGKDWLESIERPDWAAATRMHESSHVTASEALGMRISGVWANPDRDVAHGGQFKQEPAGVDGQRLAVVYAIGPEGGAKELRDRGYDDPTAHLFSVATGRNDRDEIVHRITSESTKFGLRIDGDLAHDTAVQMLASPGFQDAAHNVAEALADQGDRLTGADIRAAMGSFQLDQDLWVPTSYELTDAHPLEQHETEPDHDIEM